MKNYSKYALLLCTAAACALTACGTKTTNTDDIGAVSVATSEVITETTAAATETTAAATEAPVTETEPVATEPPTVDASYHSSLANTCWTGYDSYSQYYIMLFSEDKLTVYCSDGSKLDAWWKVKEDEPGIFFYSDAACTDPLTSMPWTYHEEQQLMMIRDVVLLPTEAADLTAAQDILSASETIQETVQGHWWCGAKEDKTVALAFSLNEPNSSAIYCKGGESLPYMGFWGMNAETFVLYDENYEPRWSFQWKLDGDMLILTDENGVAMRCQVNEGKTDAEYGEYLKTLLQ